jgi:hypothetical protein
MGLLPGRYNFKVWKGGTVSKRITIAEDAVGTPRDLTGCTAIFRVVTDTTTLEPATLTIDGPNGIVDLVIPDEVTATFDFKKANYEFLIVDTSGNADPYLWGQIQVVGI